MTVGDIRLLFRHRGGALLSRGQRWLSPASLFWRVFLVNAVLAIAAVVLLAVTPLTVSNPVTAR